MKNGANHYNAADLEVLRGLDPVKRRPGMYTDTTRPNHLAQEVIDNAVDEAIAGFATRIEVTHFKDGSIQVIDNGRGMPVDQHPEEKVSGVEVILTRLHAGAKFGQKNYQFSGGLHGVGVSVVNALSTRLGPKTALWLRWALVLLEICYLGRSKFTSPSAISPPSSAVPSFPVTPCLNLRYLSADP